MNYLKSLLFFWIVLIALSNCTHNHIVLPSEPSDYESINKKGQRLTANITLHGGDTFDMENLQAASDFVSGIDPVTKDTIGVETSEIEQIEFFSRGRGAVDGFGIGCLSGTFVGYTSGDDRSGIIRFSAEDKAYVLGITSALIGFIIGLSTGGKYIYQFGDNSSSYTQRNRK